MKRRLPHILLVNPWIYDFAAYDVWAKPFGLLSLGAILRRHGCRVSYVDCLDRFHPLSPKMADPASRNGRGPYLKTPVPKPSGLADVPRTYSRYGILPEWFLADLAAVPDPDVILVTSLMTYWYPGVKETIRLLKDCYPKAPVILGGIYATLCTDHALAHAGADRVIPGPGETRLLEMVAAATGIALEPRFDPTRLDTHPFPAFELQRKIGYVPLLTSRGCPYSCDYCASNILQPKRLLRDPALVAAEIGYWQDVAGVRDFVFYDDALLVDAHRHAIPLFEAIIRTGRDLMFHTPNAVHIREITPRLAALLYQAKVKTLRLGLETLAVEGRTMDRKVRDAEFYRAVSYLLDAGFTRDQVGAYLLVGLPGQSLDLVARSIDIVKQSGVTPILAYYTPIPHTRMWPAAVAVSRYDLDSDPVFTNNAVMPCRPRGFDWGEISKLKALVKGEGRASGI